MIRVPLGDAGVEVSRLCLGTAHFGRHTGREMAFQLLNRYVEAGGSFVDTANIYGWRGDETGQMSEMLLGEWMEARGNRDQVFVATKVGFPYTGVERGLSAEQIQEECEKSLQRLRTDTIDLYYAHVDDRNTPLEETMEALNRLVQSGKVRFIGASNYLAWRLEEARWVSATRGRAAFCCIQQRHSYLRPKPGASFDPQVASNDDLLDYCRVRGMTLLAYSPLLRGAYSRADREFPDQYLGTDSDARLATLRSVATELEATPNQVVYAWMMQSDPPVIPLVAASTLEQMDENLGTLRVRLNTEQMERLNKAGGLLHPPEP